ncbi:MAG: gamma carbonic anhydrase family protein [Bacilli bacterium]
MIKKFNNKEPIIGRECLIFENSTVIGNVKIGDNVSIWPYVTLRGDMDYITVGEFSNIQESSVIHTNFNMPTIIGKYVTIGHNAIVHGATVGDYCLIGMGAILLDKCVVEEGAVIAAGCVVPPGKIVPANHLAVGNPMKIVKELDQEGRKPFVENTMAYVELTKKYIKEKI